MSQLMVIKNKGLFTNVNQLSEVPEGALVLAKNVVVDRDSIVESRRGFNQIVNPEADTAARFDRLSEYQEKLIARASDDNSLGYWASGVGWNYYSGTYQHPDSDYARMRFLQSQGNLYFTTNNGVKVIDVYSGPVYSTGMPKGLDGVGSTTGASGFMATNTQVAYAVVWGSRDANNNLYLGAPSQRIIVSNTSGATRDVSLTFTIPDGITTSDFYQIYRSAQSATSSTEPNDELQLVYEGNPSAGQITAKSITLTEQTPESMKGAYLYTNASQEGIAESNDEPPLCKDITLFKNYTFFGNIQTKHQLQIDMLSIGGTSGYVNDDTITIDSVVYTGKAAETIASGFFKISTGGSASQNIDDTARSLVKVINQYATNVNIYAYYISGYQDLPGQILLTKRSISSGSFSVSTSRASAIDLNTGTSSNNNYINGIMWSKDEQSEHVPSSHLQLVGSKNYAIRRIIPLRDSLFILKDDGVFRLTGNAGVWAIDPLDTSTNIIAPDSAAVINNQIFCLTDQGIVAISDVGVQVISRPIEDQLQSLFSISYENVKKLSFGLSYDTDRKYILWTINSISDTKPSKAFVYNTFTQAWTTWEKDCKHAIISKSQDKMYLTTQDDQNVLVERKAYDYTDFIDEAVGSFSIVSYSSTSVVLNSITGISIGDLLFQSTTVNDYVVSIDPLLNTVIVSSDKTWSIASVSVYKGIACEIEYATNSFKNAGVMKHFQECSLLFRETSFSTASLQFFTDISGGYSNTTLSGNYGSDFWGAGVWGSGVWGGVYRPKPIRVFIPREKSRGSLLSVKFVIKSPFSKWSLNGISLEYVFVSERTTRS